MQANGMRFAARISVSAVCICSLLSVVQVNAGAQAPSAKPSAQPTAAPQKTISASVIDSVNSLAAIAAASPKDAAAWHAYGMAASRATVFAWRKSSMSLPVVKMLTAAESSLARAARLAPDSAQYAVDFAEHLFGVNNTNITWATDVLEKALRVAKTKGDARNVARAADQLGMMMWRSFEWNTWRRDVIVPLGGGYDELLTRPWMAAKWLDRDTRPYVPPIGEGMYTTAYESFYTARTADPSSETYLRHEFIPYLERDRWSELEAAADLRTRQSPKQAWAWLGLGLAQHRLGRAAQASASFEKGLALLPAEERARLTQSSRVYTTRDAAWYAKQSEQGRASLDAMYWQVGNPSLLMPTNTLYNEFLARVVFSEVLWTDDEQHHSGIDSDRGDVFVRFGPPDIRATIDEQLIWSYRAAAIFFMFDRVPTYSSAKLDDRTREHVLFPMKTEKGATWTNVPLMSHRIDSIALQAVRFRGAGDSTDVAVYTGVRMGQLLLQHPLGSAPVDLGLFALGPSGEIRNKALRSVVATESDTLRQQSVNWRMRVSPTTMSLRVDALQKETMRAARWLADFPIEVQNGFGLSDVVVANRATLRTDINTPPRWSDYDIEANPSNVFSRKQPLDVLWETYELAPKDGAVSYRLSVTLQRLEDKGAGTIVAKIIGGMTNAVGITSNTDNSITIAYDRTGGALPVLVENVRIDISNAPTGRYVLSATVLDKITGRAERSAHNIVITN